MRTQPHVFVVIPVHDRVRYTLACLASLAEQTYPSVTVIVVDDGSTDGTGSQVRQAYPATVVLPGDGDLWWAGSVNLGIAWALGRAADGDVVVLMNNDTTVSPAFLASLLAAADGHPGALIGSLVVDADDPCRPLDWGVRIHWWLGGRLDDAPPPPPFVDSGTPSCRAVDVLTGRGTLIPVPVLKALGPFAAGRLPQYGADYEYARRAHRAGYEVLVNRSSVVSSHAEVTGLNPGRQKVGPLAFARSFWSVRSHRSLKYGWRFAHLCLPSPKAEVYFASSAARNFVSATREQLHRRLTGVMPTRQRDRQG